VEGRILIVEDDLTVAEVVVDYLRHAGLEPRHALDGQSALEVAATWRPDLVVLDLMLPGVGGLEVCRQLREGRDPQGPLPVIMLTALGEESDRVRGLEGGADDYVTKPFSPRELTARVQAAIRRRRKTGLPAIYRFGDCEIDFKKMTVQRSGIPVILTAHEFKLLKFFTENSEQVLKREALLNEVWGYNSYPTTRTVDNQILKLRQKLESDPANPTHFLTIYGAGYKFVP
jgi:DNA-binding response OmpR family regulator